jgi:preprotein translocase subunit SecE
MNSIICEFKKIKWLSMSNTCKQTLYVTLVIIGSAVTIGAFDALVKYIYSLFF